MVTLTEKQELFVSCVLNSKDSFYEKKTDFLKSSWVLSDLTVELDHQMSTMTMGAMVTTLKQKMLLESTKTTRVTDSGQTEKIIVIKLTDHGRDVMRTLF